jgi:hypothetical protein
LAFKLLTGVFNETITSIDLLSLGIRNFVYRFWLAFSTWFIAIVDWD